MAERDWAKSLAEVREYNRLRYQWVAERIVQLLPGDAKIVDAACGTGYGTLIMKRRGIENVRGYDLSVDAMRHGVRYLGCRREWFSAADLEHGLSVPGGYHGLVSFETVEHLSDPGPFLRSVREAVPVAAWLSVPNQDRVPFDPERHRHHYRHYDPADFVDLIAEHINPRRLTLFAQFGKNGHRAVVRHHVPYPRVGKPPMTLIAEVLL